METDETKDLQSAAVILLHRTLESVLSGSIDAWFGSCSSRDKAALHGVRRWAPRIIRPALPSLSGIYARRWRPRANRPNVGRLK